ncbi:hypothetical protein PTKIN_Ptkin01aG0246000 [Pterospermum kingtungense]
MSSNLDKTSMTKTNRDVKNLQDAGIYTYNGLMMHSEAILLPPWVALAVHLRPGVWEYIRVNVHAFVIEELTVATTNGNFVLEKVVSEDGKKISRKHPFIENDKEEVQLHARVEYDSIEIFDKAKLNDERNWRKGLPVRLLLRFSPKSVLKNRKSEFDDILEEVNSPLTEHIEDFS